MHYIRFKLRLWSCPGILCYTNWYSRLLCNSVCLSYPAHTDVIVAHLWNSPSKWEFPHYRDRDRVRALWRCSVYPASWGSLSAREGPLSTASAGSQVSVGVKVVSQCQSLLPAGDVSAGHCHHQPLAQVRPICQTSCLLSAGPGTGGPDKTEGGGGGSSQLLCPKCGSPCEHVATFISSTRWVPHLDLLLWSDLRSELF